MKTYKGLNKNFSCREFKYKIGKKYSKKTKSELCTDKGFHSCENPLEVFSFYSPSDSRFAECEIGGKMDKDDHKICSQKLKIISEISLHELIKCGVEYILSKTENKKKEAGNRSAATNTGHQSVATNTGYQSAAIVNGHQSIAIASGYESKAKGARGCWLVLAEWDEDAENIINVKSRKVDGKHIKADTFYMLKNNKFIEVS